MHQPLRLLPCCLLLSLIPLTSAHAETIDCDTLGDNASLEAGTYRPPLEAKVIDQGRLYFHSAPSPACISKKLFVIPGDSLTVYASSESGWAQVMYIAKNGEDYTGWVEEKRLKLGDHYGGGNDTEQPPEHRASTAP